MNFDIKTDKLDGDAYVSLFWGDINNPDLTRNGRSIVFDYQDFSGDGIQAPTDGREPAVNRARCELTRFQVDSVTGDNGLIER